MIDDTGLPQLHVHSAYSFLAGASDPETLVAEAAAAGVKVMALTDWHRVSGLVQFLSACERVGITGIAGATVNLADLGNLVLLAPEPEAYPQLVALLTQSHLAHPRGAPVVTWDDLEVWGAGLVALSGGRRGPIDRALLAGRQDEARRMAERLRRLFGGEFYLELSAGWLPGDGAIRRQLRDLGEALRIPLAAVPEVRHARPEDFPLYDLLVCIGQRVPVDRPHPARPFNGELHIKTRRQVAAALGDLAGPALTTTDRLAERLRPPRLLGVRRLPQLVDPRDAYQMLAHKVWAGARHRYGVRLPQVRERIRHELSIIRDLGYADYFLVVEDVVRFARARGIRYAGRGSAADSVVAYCLGITLVDAAARDLLFERFLSRERAETPDIDIDFDARRRDEVASYVEQRYGAERVAAVATYQTFRARLALRQIGKALGFPDGDLDLLAKSLPSRRLCTIAEHWEEIPELRTLSLPAAFRTVVAWAARAEGLPRHLGTHLGGLVISGEPLAAVTPVERAAKGVRVVQFDKRDVEALGLLKLDLLSLRTFSAVELATTAIRHQDPAFRYERLPDDDPAVYRRLQAADTIGVFQLESPAQRALARRLHPDRYEDIVASLAIIRPGPIKGNMVDPFVARRRGEEPVSYLHPELEPILRKTYGVVLFQEQVIAIASQLAGFTPGEADQLRRVMTHARSPAVMEALGEQFRMKAIRRGVPETVAEAVFAQIVGYASYGFNEAHAASFADTAYRTAYLLEHYPGPFYAGLLEAQPMGYYPADVLVTEARRRGLRILPVDINASAEGFTWDPNRQAIRVGLSAVAGIGEEAARRIVTARGDAPFRHPAEVMARAGLSREQAAALIRIGAFDALSADREGWLDSLWGDNGLGFSPVGPARPWSRSDTLFWEYRLLGFGQTAQLMSIWRDALAMRGYCTAAEAQEAAEGTRLRLAGCLVRPHRPPTRSGRLVVFFSLLDETGLIDASLGEEGYQRFGHLLFSAKSRGMLAVSGIVRRGALWVDRMGPWPPDPMRP
jgi:error-prone DNA polymerase